MRHFFKTKQMASLLNIVILIFAMFKAHAQGQIEQTDDLILLENMQTEAAYAGKSCLPMVIMVSQFSCAHCKKLREKVLLPLLKSGELDDKALMRELVIDSDELIIDLNGNTSTGMQVAKGYIENLITPTMLIIDPSGNELAQRIVGINNIDFYSLYLEAEINAAHIKMKPTCSQNSTKKQV